MADFQSTVSLGKDAWKCLDGDQEEGCGWPRKRRADAKIGRFGDGREACGSSGKNRRLLAAIRHATKKKRHRKERIPDDQVKIEMRKCAVASDVRLPKRYYSVVTDTQGTSSGRQDTLNR